MLLYDNNPNGIQTNLKNGIVYCLIVLLFSLSAKSQNVDSLLRVWNDTSQADTVRLQTINYIVMSLFRDDPDSALELVDEMLELAISKELPLWQAEGLQLKGQCFVSVRLSHISVLDELC